MSNQGPTNGDAAAGVPSNNAPSGGSQSSLNGPGGAPAGGTSGGVALLSDPVDVIIDKLLR